jgi:hypothetical protein
MQTIRKMLVKKSVPRQTSFWKKSANMFQWQPAPFLEKISDGNKLFNFLESRQFFPQKLLGPKIICLQKEN